MGVICFELPLPKVVVEVVKFLLPLTSSGSGSRVLVNFGFNGSGSYGSTTTKTTMFLSFKGDQALFSDHSREAYVKFHWYRLWPASSAHTTSISGVHSFI